MCDYIIILNDDNENYYRAFKAYESSIVKLVTTVIFPNQENFCSSLVVVKRMSRSEGFWTSRLFY